MVIIVLILPIVKLMTINIGKVLKFLIIIFCLFASFTSYSSEKDAVNNIVKDAHKNMEGNSENNVNNVNNENNENNFIIRRYPMISLNYRMGSYLIYDCEDKHYACVDKESYDKCRNWRDKAIYNVEEFMPCAPLAVYKKLKECKKAHYQSMQRPVFNKFCYRTKK